MPSEDVVYWDSDLFISRIQRTPGRIEVLEELSNMAERGELKIATSAFALVEVAKLDDSDLLPDEQEQAIVAFFENPYIVVIPLDELAARLARQLIRDNRGLKGKDAVHVASAIRRGIPIMHAYDRGILRLDGSVPNLRIEQPRCDQRNLGFSTATGPSDDGRPRGS